MEEYKSLLAEGGKDDSRDFVSYLWCSNHINDKYVDTSQI
jgi:hypothetical protein